MSTRTPVRPAPPRDAGRARATPHPRIRARRVEVARDAGRRRLRRLNVVLGVVATVVWALVVLQSPLLDVDRVNVAGTSQTDVDDVVAVADVDAGEAMVDVDLGRVERSVAALPWVAEVRATRMWPGTVRIVVTEREPLAALAHPGGWALVDAGGRVLAVVADRSPLPVVEGRTEVLPGGAVGPEERSLLRTLVRLPQAFRAEVAVAGTGDDGHEVVLASGERVVLGDGTDLDAKLTAARAVADDADPADGCRIDVRVPTAPVLTLDGSCA